MFFWDGLFSGVMLASRSVTVEATNISSFLKLSIFCFLTGALGIYIYMCEIPSGLADYPFSLVHGWVGGVNRSF